MEGGGTRHEAGVRWAVETRVVGVLEEEGRVAVKRENRVSHLHLTERGAERELSHQDKVDGEVFLRALDDTAGVRSSPRAPLPT